MLIKQNLSLTPLELWLRLVLNKIFGLAFHWVFFLGVPIVKVLTPQGECGERGRNGGLLKKKDFERRRRRRRCWDLFPEHINHLWSSKSGSICAGWRAARRFLISALLRGDSEVPRAMCPCQGLQGWEGDSHLLERKEEEGLGSPQQLPGSQPRPLSSLHSGKRLFNK